MGYKWIGALLIIGSCSGCGFAIAAGKRREQLLLSQLLDVLRFLENELQYRLTDLPELCRLAAANTGGDLGRVFAHLNRELNSRTLPDAGSCMYAAIQHTGDIPARVRRLLVQLGNGLGQFDLPGQLSAIRAAGKRCGESLEAVRKNREERLRSYQTLGVCAGAALAVILI